MGSEEIRDLLTDMAARDRGTWDPQRVSTDQ